MEKRRHELPIRHWWYGKHAYRPIEEVIDKWPDYFCWAVSSFQDVTVQQAKYFQEKYGMELPPEVIAPAEVEPFVFTKGMKSEDYTQACKEYVAKYFPDEVEEETEVSQ